MPVDANRKAALAITENTERFQLDAQSMCHFAHSLPIIEIKARDFDLVFLVGGYGAMWDFTGNECLKLLLKDFVVQDKSIGLVGHAIVALVSLKNKNKIGYVVNSSFHALGGITIVVNLREKDRNKLMKKSSLRSHSFFQFTHYNFKKANGFS